MTKYLKTKEGSIEDVAKQMQNKVMENDYQDKFKKELDKAGKPLGQMTGAEKKSFFNKIDKMHKGKNESLDNKDKPAVKKIITKLKGASQAHADQAKGLQKALQTEKVDNPYAVGMSQAMKSTGDTPPLKKSTITKAHDIAKSIKKDEMKETHMSTAKKQNQSQKNAKGEKEIVKLTAKEDKEWKTFAQMRAEIDEACWDSHKQVGFKMKGGKRVPNCVPKNEEADKGKKEQEAGDDNRDKKVKTMTGQVATSPEMNPKVDYKY